jgi:hypothetical protein
LKEDHPLALTLSFSVSLGLLPVILSLGTTGCGIKNIGDQMEADKNSEQLLLFNFLVLLAVTYKLVIVITTNANQYASYPIIMIYTNIRANKSQYALYSGLYYLCKT